MTCAEPVVQPIMVLVEAPKQAKKSQSAKPILCKICDSEVPPERLKLEGAASKYCSQDCQDIAWHRPARCSNWKKRRESIRKAYGFHFEVVTPVMFAGLLHGSKI